MLGNWGSLCENTPVIGTNTFDTKPRDRVLSDAELAAIWKAAPDNDYRRIVKLLMLTGQRRDEIACPALARNRPGRQANHAVSARTKNGLEHRIPLASEATAILRSCNPHRDLVFGIGQDGYSGWSKSNTALAPA